MIKNEGHIKNTLKTGLKTKSKKEIKQLIEKKQMERVKQIKDKSKCIDLF